MVDGALGQPRGLLLRLAELIDSATTAEDAIRSDPGLRSDVAEAMLTLCRLGRNADPAS